MNTASLPLQIGPLFVTVPTVGAAVTFTVTSSVSFGQGLVPVTVYRKVEVVEPAVTVNVPDPASNEPPVPVVRVHTPPVCSPVIRLNKSTTVLEPAHAVVFVPVPAFACGVMFTVATDWLFGQGGVPIISYWNVELVAPAAGVNVPAPALNVPPVPVRRVQVPPVCSPVIRLNRSIAATELSHTDVDPSVPALACGEIFNTYATDGRQFASAGVGFWIA